MRRRLGLVIAVPLVGCQAPAPRPAVAPDGDDALRRLNAALPGDYDNHEQVLQAARGAGGGKAVAVPHLRETWRLLSSSRDSSLWLWRLRELDRADAPEAVWLYLVSPAAGGGGLVLTPYRPVDAAAANAAMEAPRFTFVPAQWAELAPCAQRGEWKNTQFSSAANRDACAAHVPGLGAAAALLRLRLTLDGERLETATFTDLARGADAGVGARRVRWFDGWWRSTAAARRRARPTRTGTCARTCASAAKAAACRSVGATARRAAIRWNSNAAATRNASSACSSSTWSRTRADRWSITSGPARRRPPSASISAGCRSA